MSVDVSALKLMELGNTLSQDVSMATLLVASTWHSHTEPLSGTLTNQYIANPNEEREGWVGER